MGSFGTRVFNHACGNRAPGVRGDLVSEHLILRRWLPRLVLVFQIDGIRVVPLVHLLTNATKFVLCVFNGFPEPLSSLASSFRWCR